MVELFFLRGAVGLINPSENRAFRRHNRLDIEPGHELDVVHREYVGGIHHGDGQRRADAAQRKNLIALRRFKWNELYDRGVNFKIGQVDGGNAILTREKVGDVLVRKEAELHQGRAQAAALFLLNLRRFIQLLWGNHLLFN